MRWQQRDGCVGFVGCDGYVEVDDVVFASFVFVFPWAPPADGTHFCVSRIAAGARSWAIQWQSCLGCVGFDGCDGYEEGG